jgi:hypothetical protein
MQALYESGRGDVNHEDCDRDAPPVATNPVTGVAKT